MLWELVGVVAASTGEATYINKPTETICMHKLFVGFFMYAYFSRGPSPKRICIHKLSGAKVYVYIFFSSVFYVCAVLLISSHTPRVTALGKLSPIFFRGFLEKLLPQPA